MKSPLKRSVHPATSTCSVSAASGCRGDRRPTSSDRQQGKGQRTLLADLLKLNVFVPGTRKRGALPGTAWPLSASAAAQIARSSERPRSKMILLAIHGTEERRNLMMIFFDNYTDSFLPCLLNW